MIVFYLSNNGMKWTDGIVTLYGQVWKLWLRPICRVANNILSKPQRNEMNRQYRDGRCQVWMFSPHSVLFLFSQMRHDEMGVRSDSLTF